jgi:hypothetical protein
MIANAAVFNCPVNTCGNFLSDGFANGSVEFYLRKELHMDTRICGE